MQQWIELVQQGKDLTIDQMQSAIGCMLRGESKEDDVRTLLLALREKGESVSELVGAAKAMRAAMTPIASSRRPLLDTCGTGGDGAKTFNISTAAAIVAAAAGANVAKHGNRKITSVTGSADVLAELGIDVEAGRETIERCLQQVRICFCFAPLLHPAMKHVSQVRKSISVPTLFNYLGPLCNPAGAEFQLLGVGRPDLQEKIAQALSHLPIQRALVVRGEDGMDEISLASSTRVLIVSPGHVIEEKWTPEQLGFSIIDPVSLYAGNPAESAAVIRKVLSGEKGAPRDVVVANAAAGIWLCDLAPSIQDAVSRCESAIDGGDANLVLKRLAEESRR